MGFRENIQVQSAFLYLLYIIRVKYINHLIWIKSSMKISMIY